MVVALLLMLAGTVVTGVMSLGADRHAGRLAFFYATTLDSGSRALIERHRGSHGRSETTDGEKSVLGELHEVLANLTLALIVLHIVGVVLGSIVHRENLILAMINGRKRGESGRRTLPKEAVFGR